MVAHAEGPRSDHEPSGAHVAVDRPERPLVLRLGLVAWSLVGFVIVLTVVIGVLASLSSLVFPLLFAGVLAVIFRPIAARLEQRMPAALASIVVVVGVVLFVIGLVVAVTHGITSQTTRIGDEIAAGLSELDVTAESTDEVRAELEQMRPTVTLGMVDELINGISALAGLAAGAVLGVLIMYYLLKDGPELRRTVVGEAMPEVRPELDQLVSESCQVLRRYWWGRTIVSAIVAGVVAAGAALLGLPMLLTIAVVTFVGGYIPYIGAIAGGALAVLVALANEGLGAALAILAVVLIANLLVENLVEPMVTGRTLQIHPLVVILVTTTGGIVGGLTGLILAVPLTVIAMKVVRRLPRILDLRVAAGAVRRTIERTVDLPLDHRGTVDDG